MINKKLLTAIGTIIFLFSLSLSSIAAYSGQGINEGFTKPTKAQVQAEIEKAKIAESYVTVKRSLKSEGNSKTNEVGQDEQAQTYTCGPASARNAIYGYVLWNGYGEVPSEATLGSSSYLNTTTAGTGFDATRWANTMDTFAPGNDYMLVWGTSNWNADLATRVIWTIDRSSNYNVIGNLFHGQTDTPINPIYANGVEHYICIYGYNDSTGIYNISDSYSGITHLYTTPYINAANSTHGHGIIW